MWDPLGYRGPDGDAGVALVAGQQGGVIAAAQLAALGITRRARDRRVAAGRLHRLHRGVYAVGHPTLTPRGDLIAAILACGPSAVASHRSAAWVHDLLPIGTVHHVTSPARCRRPGICTHQSVLDPNDVTNVRGLPITTVARTLLDLAETETPRKVEQAMDQAEFQRILSLSALDEVMARANGRRGLKTLTDLRHGHTPGTTGTRSELEEQFFALLRSAGLPLPAFNQRIGEFQVDCHWPELRLIVELDGAAAHSTHKRQRKDRRRDVDLLVDGWRTARFTWEDVIHDPDWVLERMSRLLARGAESRATVAA